MSGATVRSRFPMRRRMEVAEKRAAVGEKSVPSRLTRMLALAHHVERLIEAGELESYSAVAHALGLTRARLTQVMRLLQLAPEVQEQVLLGKLDWTERRLRQVVREASWRRQLAICGRTNARLGGRERRGSRR